MICIHLVGVQEAGKKELSQFRVTNLEKVNCIYRVKVIDSKILPIGSQEGVYVEKMFQKCRRIIWWVWISEDEV